MTDWISQQIIHFLCSKGAIRQNDEVALYGCNAVVYTLLSTAGLVIISILCGQATEGVVLIAFFYINQSFGGGYHAKTHIRCFLTMMLGLLVGLLLGRIQWDNILVFAIGSTSLFIMMMFPLVLHPHMIHIDARRSHYVKRSRMCLLTETILFLFIAIFGSEKMTTIITIALFLSALSRCVAFCMYRRDATYDKNEFIEEGADVSK